MTATKLRRMLTLHPPGGRHLDPRGSLSVSDGEGTSGVSPCMTARQPPFELEGLQEDHENRAKGRLQFDYLAETSELVLGWASCWGGVHNWNGALDHGYQAAKNSGDLNHWLSDVLEHADRGRLLVRMLDQTSSALPTEMWKIRELWRQQVSLLTLVLKALALIEVRIDLVKMGPFNLCNWDSATLNGDNV